MQKNKKTAGSVLQLLIAALSHAIDVLSGLNHCKLKKSHTLNFSLMTEQNCQQSASNEPTHDSCELLWAEYVSVWNHLL